MKERTLNWGNLLKRRIDEKQENVCQRHDTDDLTNWNGRPSWLLVSYSESDIRFLRIVSNVIIITLAIGIIGMAVCTILLI
jgi:hypothetical protein